MATGPWTEFCIIVFGTYVVTLTTDDNKLSRHIWASKQAVIYKARQTENSEPRVPIGWRQQG